MKKNGKELSLIDHDDKATQGLMWRLVTIGLCKQEALLLEEVIENHKKATYLNLLCFLFPTQRSMNTKCSECTHPNACEKSTNLTRVGLEPTTSRFQVQMS